MLHMLQLAPCSKSAQCCIYAHKLNTSYKVLQTAWTTDSSLSSLAASPLLLDALLYKQVCAKHTSERLHVLKKDGCVIAGSASKAENCIFTPRLCVS